MSVRRTRRCLSGMVRVAVNPTTHATDDHDKHDAPVGLLKAVRNLCVANIPTARESLTDMCFTCRAKAPNGA
jgi:hypothetical protein